MKITIFLDTICGWCYIGHNRLFKALAEFKDKKFEVHYLTLFNLGKINLVCCGAG